MKFRLLSPRTLTRLIAVMLATLLLLPQVKEARAATPVIDAANLSQNIATRAQTWTAILQRINQISNQIRQIRIQIEQLLLAHQNLVHLGVDFRPVQTEIHRLLITYHRLLREGRALVYTMNRLAETFDEVFHPGASAVPWREEQQRRVETTLATYRAALRASQAVGNRSFATQERNRQLMEQALDTRGNLAALHAQALIQGHTAQEISKTAEQLATLNNLLAVEHAFEVASEASAERSLEAWVEPAMVAGPYASYRRFDPLPDLTPNPPVGSTPRQGR